MSLQLRRALLVGLLMLPACTRGSGTDTVTAPVRQSPVAVPSAPSETAETEEPAPSELIDPEAGEQLAMRATAAVTVTGAAGAATLELAQNPDADSLLEQNSGETERVLRLATADPKRVEDVQFGLDGRATPGTFKTGTGDLQVVFYDATRGIDVFSENGECTVTFERVDVRGVAGTVTCADVQAAAGKSTITATFTATATDPP